MKIGLSHHGPLSLLADLQKNYTLSLDDTQNISRAKVVDQNLFFAALCARHFYHGERFRSAPISHGSTRMVARKLWRHVCVVQTEFDRRSAYIGVGVDIQTQLDSAAVGHGDFTASFDCEARRRAEC